MRDSMGDSSVAHASVLPKVCIPKWEILSVVINEQFNK